MLNFTGHQVSISGKIELLLVFILFAYGLAGIYNFWILFNKAGKHGWAAIIPIYGPIVACKIAKRPFWFGIIFASFSIIEYSEPSALVYFIYSVQLIVLLSIGIYILIGMSKVYKVQKGFWVFVVVLPLIASFMTGSLKYTPNKALTTKS